MKKKENVDKKVLCALCGVVQNDLKAHYAHVRKVHGLNGQEAYRLGMVALNKWRAKLKKRAAAERDEEKVIQVVSPSVVSVSHPVDELPF